MEEKGLAKNEVAKLREIIASIEQKGPQAVREIKASPTHPQGVENLVTNMVVQRPQYLGKLIQDGHVRYGEVAANTDRYAQREQNRRTDDIETERSR